MRGNTAILIKLNQNPFTNQVKTLVQDVIDTSEQPKGWRGDFYPLDITREALRRDKIRQYGLSDEGWFCEAWIDALERKGWKEVFLFPSKEETYWDGQILRPLVTEGKFIVGLFKLMPKDDGKKRRRKIK